MNGVPNAIVGLSCSALAAWLAWHHPLSPLLALLAVGATVAVAAWQPLSVPVLLLALLPAAGLAPWTGWMLVEEFDLLLLALLAGAWLRLASGWRLQLRPPGDNGVVRVWWLLVLVYAGLAASSVWRGLVDAGAWSQGPLAWGWWQGWREPMNVLRTIKPLVWAILAWPLWQALQARDPDAAARAVARGAVAGLALVAAVATWERWAWPGLGNFNMDYRTTALFWETHVGGAALDGFLALTVPFGLAAIAAARSPASRLAAAGLVCLVGYAVLTTFSRGLYLGVLAGALIWWAMTPRPKGSTAASRFVPVAWVAAFGVAAVLAFPGGGWRALGALWGLVLLLFWGWQRGASLASTRDLAMAAGGGCLAGVLGVGASLALPAGLKAPYLFYALVAFTCALAWHRPVGPGRARAGWAAWAGSAAAAVGLAVHWGVNDAHWGMLGAVGLLVVCAGMGATYPGWRGQPGEGWRLPAVAGMAVVGVVVGSFAGGGYLKGRLAMADDDWQGRLRHWSRSLSLVQGDVNDWLGIGPGRFPAHFALSGEATDQVGDYRWQALPDRGGTVILTGGKHMLGFGELFRMSQRVRPPEGAVRVRWRAQVEAPVRLHVEICSKHLLYGQGCSSTVVDIGGSAKAPTPGWHEGELSLKPRNDWRQPVFSVAVDTRGGWLRVDDLQVTDSFGHELVRNGSFENGLVYWLPSSDRHHLPWHAKNLVVHLRVEQGWLGLAGFAVLLAFAFARVTVGRARHHALAPSLLAGLAGFVIVGAFDSLLDIPRVAFAFLWMLGVAATLRAPRSRPSGAALPT